MSSAEQLQAMEFLRDDLPIDDDSFESPAWHEAALRQAQEDVKSGKVVFSDWEVVKERMRRRMAEYHELAHP
jgi:hypothetical protein